MRNLSKERASAVWRRRLPVASAPELPCGVFWGRGVLHTAWIGALSGWSVLTMGRFGFSPTDQGFTLALSARLLDGEVPHLDVVSARPLGSAALHTVDLLLPGPLFVVSSGVAMVELVVATVCLAALLTRRPVLTWGPLLTAGVAATALVNLHTFPLMAWHTIDGIAATASGWWALDAGLRSGSAWQRRGGLLLLGWAALTKQSFVLAALVGLVILLATSSNLSGRQKASSVQEMCDREPGEGRDAQWRARTAVDVLCLGAAPLLYVAIVTASGGLPEMLRQLTGARATWFGRLFEVWTVPAARFDLWQIAACAAVLGGLVALRPRLGHGVLVRCAEAVAALGAGLATVLVVLDGHLARAGDWGIVLLWGLLFVAGVHGLRTRRVPYRALLVALLAWMSALSWGYDSPTLLGGTLAFSTVWLLIPFVPFDRCRLRLRGPAGEAESASTGVSAKARGPWRTAGAVLLGGALLVPTAQFVVREQHRSPYRDLPQPMLTASLGEVMPALRGVRSNPTVARYVEQIRDCIERYPAARVAVLPDNAFVYPALGLDNPLPLDWLWQDELGGGARDRVLEAVAELAEDGDYLVLFQTVDWTALAAGVPLPESVPVDAPIFGYTDLEATIRADLDGRPITCGSFVGNHRN